MPTAGISIAIYYFYDAYRIIKDKQSLSGHGRLNKKEAGFNQHLFGVHPFGICFVHIPPLF